jgi:hypothetical protein
MIMAGADGDRDVTDGIRKPAGGGASPAIAAPPRAAILPPLTRMAAGPARQPGRSPFAVGERTGPFEMKCS